MATVELPREGAPPPDLDSGSFFEIIDGQIVERPPMGAFEVWVASVLFELLLPHVRGQRLGRVVSEMLFDLRPAVDRSRRPDVAFVSYGRWPRNHRVPLANAWSVVPDLAVEVVSPTDPATDLIDRLAEYFRAGVRACWVVYPRHELIYVYESLRSVKGYGRGDAIDGGSVLPGFRLDVAGLFDEAAGAD